MIVVIADDFTGAAELGAVGLRYNLNAEIQTRLDLNSKAQMLIIDTDTRSLDARATRRILESLGRQLCPCDVEWYYKKVDSLLRGNILIELDALLQTLKYQRSMLVPANPSKGRTITNGCYYINGLPIDKTDFVNDPEHPAKSSSVIDLLCNVSEIPLEVLNPDQLIPAKGIFLCQAKGDTDVQAWTCRLDEHTIPSGGSDFFAAILQAKGLRKKTIKYNDDFSTKARALFVCGSASDYSCQAIQQASNYPVGVCPLPNELFNSVERSDELSLRWAKAIVGALEKNDKVIASISHRVVQDASLAQRLRAGMASMVEEVLEKVDIRDLYIEGGATAEEVIQRMGWQRFSVCGELAPGVVRMQISSNENQYLTVKPGSYPWPDNIWKS
jgi:uncharacterized protein YgbK (DUF1537 family)